MHDEAACTSEVRYVKQVSPTCMQASPANAAMQVYCG